MNLIITLLVLAIVIPALALLGHLYVAYSLAPKRAKRAILDALVQDKEFQSDLMKTLLNNLFSEVSDGDVRVIPIDKIISRAKLAFGDWIKNELPGNLPDTAMMPQTVNEYGDPVPPDPLQAILYANMPKNMKKWLPIVQLLLKR